MHEHPDAVAVDLTTGSWKMTDPDGKTEEITGKIGQVMWTPAVKHLPENTGDKPAEVILVETKVQPAAKSLTASVAAQDASKLDPAHYKVEFENDHVRVVRISYGPGEKSVMHEHHDGVVVSLTDGTGKFTFPDGTTQENTGKAGQVVWAKNPKIKITNKTHTEFIRFFMMIPSLLCFVVV